MNPSDSSLQGSLTAGGAASVAISVATVTTACMDDQVLNTEEQLAYDAATALLQTSATFLAPLPSIVSLRNVVMEAPTTSEEWAIISSLTNASTSTITGANDSSNRSASSIPHPTHHHHNHPHNHHHHHALVRALEELDHLEREEQKMLTVSSLTPLLTGLVTSSSYPSGQAALETLEALGKSIPRRVCQHPFKRNDIVWVCRTCQADETCVLCHSCFSQSHHEGHDVAFYHAQAGGCCDCGDPDAWDPAGFCPFHGPTTNSLEGGLSSPAVGQRVKGMVLALIDWMVHTIAHNAQVAHQRVDNAVLPLTHPLAMPATAATRHGALLPPSLWTVARHHRVVDDTNDDMDDSPDDHDNNNNNTSTNPLPNFEDHAHVFLPAAASASKSRNETFLSTTCGATANNNNNTPSSSSAASTATSDQEMSIAEQLGHIARAGQGIYIVVHADDIHTLANYVDALQDLLGPSSYYTDSLLEKVARALRDYGQLIVWGTCEVVADCHPNQIHLWLDGDRTTSARVGALVLARVARLIRHGLHCSLVTRVELELEQRAVVLLQWLTALARSCDPLCQRVAESILPDRHLVTLLRTDFMLSARITKAWHALLLTLLAVPVFKSHLAAAYCDTYQQVSMDYARGRGVLERSCFTLAVQFLNRVTYVIDLVQRRDLLGKLGQSLLQTLQVAVMSANANNAAGHNHRTSLTPTQHQAFQRTLNPNHFVLTHRRYSPCISDLKCVLNVKGMARLFANRSGTFLHDWIEALRLCQYMDWQTWRTWSQGHVEVEPRGWVGAFNASISLGSLFERLLSWDDVDDDDGKGGNAPVLPDPSLNPNLMNIVELTLHVLTTGLASWQHDIRMIYQPTCNHTMSTTAGTTSSSAAAVAPSIMTPLDPQARCSASLPFSTTASVQGSHLAFGALPLAQVSPWSFHLPLHRFLAACLREVCRRPWKSDNQKGSGTDISGMLELLQSLHVSGTSGTVSTSLDPHLLELVQGVMEFPVLVLTRAAQIRAGLWRRNGPNMHDQVLNYGEPPFCRSMRDADLLLLQFSILVRGNSGLEGRPASDVGTVFAIHLLLHRLGIFDFCGFAKAPAYNVSRYQNEIASGLYPREVSIDGNPESASLPWTYTPSPDTTTSLFLLEEFLHIIIVLITELPPPPPNNRLEHTHQARQRLLREVVHRLASGPKTHSELSEVHHVLSHWDNVYLNEEGKLRNPDDASGAAVESALAEVADRRSSRGKLEPDKWELQRSAWELYDPAFFHVSLRSHQSAAERRPKPESAKTPTTSRWGCILESKSYAPPLCPSHPDFERLRRDLTADASVLAVVYRTLHVHCRLSTTSSGKDLADLRGRQLYESDERSETALARALHLLSLGAQSWAKAGALNVSWRELGGGSIGSVFYDRHEAPTASSWIAAALLSEPGRLMNCDWYEGEDNALLLLRRLAMDGGATGNFVAQDKCVRAGAAWLCDFALEHSSEAARWMGLTSPSQMATDAASEGGTSDPNSAESQMERKKQDARARAMERMRAQAEKFASSIKVDIGDDESTHDEEAAESNASLSVTPVRPERNFSLTSAPSSSSISSSTESERGIAPFLVLSPAAGDAMQESFEDIQIPSRLLKSRPQCIICNDDGNGQATTNALTIPTPYTMDDDGHRKGHRRRSGGGNVLAFVGYAQASCVLKGCCGPPAPNDSTPTAPLRRFVGTHLALCGHAVHNECCESYLASVSHREDRVIGKRGEEFRCPLCQRLSNCLVPFIDVGADWIESPLRVNDDSPVRAKRKSEDGDTLTMLSADNQEPSRQDLNEFLANTPWWVSRQDPGVMWDGQSAFITVGEPRPIPEEESERSRLVAGNSPIKPPKRRSVRSLRKKDLYAAWNAMMKTPRFVRRKLRSKSLAEDLASSLSGPESSSAHSSSMSDDSTGETLVWRRFMDVVCDASFRADLRRLGDDGLHQNVGEFRHYIMEKHAYNMANRAAGKEPADWPSCIFATTMPDSAKQELAREKLLSKLFTTIQSLTYSTLCEAHEARRLLRKQNPSINAVAGVASESSTRNSVQSSFGVGGVICDGKLLLLPPPTEHEDDGSQPFQGRIGKLRYLALAVMAAAGAVAADLIQLVVSFPTDIDSLKVPSPPTMDLEKPDRAPISYPILLGHVLTHVVSSICAACGRARARSDYLDLAWSPPFSKGGSFVHEKRNNKPLVDVVVEDCEGFIKLGLLARMLQVLLGKLGADCDVSRASHLKILHSLGASWEPDRARFSPVQCEWLQSCFQLLQLACYSDTKKDDDGRSTPDFDSILLERFIDACSSTASAASSYLADIGVLFQVVVPGVMARYDCSTASLPITGDDDGDVATFHQLRTHFKIEKLDDMLKSPLVCEVVSKWYLSAQGYLEASKDCEAEVSASALSNTAVRRRLHQSDGFRVMDWPLDASFQEFRAGLPDEEEKSFMSPIPHDASSSFAMEIDGVASNNQTPEAEFRRRQTSAPLVTFSSKKSIPLICSVGLEQVVKGRLRPRVAALPTSYTDLYAELGALLPESEQTAVCLICGEVLNAAGKGECTKHSFMCGAGMGMFFLLQECSGLIMHNGKAAYIHSPYVDSHGETPQYRGRPLNLDLDRYEILREMWFGHTVRQKVVAERATARQVIISDFY